MWAEYELRTAPPLALVWGNRGRDGKEAPWIGAWQLPGMQRLGFDVRLAYASFPIDWFLMHPGSNYVADPAQGKPAHRARMAIDLVLAQAGMGAYLGLAKALFACGAGRSLTVIARPLAKVGRAA